ncbi:hypothetical protein [Paenibacillus methanolicus]|uniref:Uncharacterized protein n=1 Tax=Paenibacillus methanolicus TaxID=582686 RepID=A0A5S5CBD1_9BACL|nr:hypothetical protein [Paenibacillus methanolicus]TYP76685.1 hypothetical protein BCM02_103349 [Paenibacillus methanolicus]
MPINLEQQIFTKPSGNLDDWATIRGSSLVEVQSVERRGINEGVRVIGEVEGRITNILNEWADLDILGKISLEGSLAVQLQTPLNFFDQIGLAARVQAIARAAIAIGIESNITVGQIMNRVTERPEIQGIPEKLFRLVLDEIVLEGDIHAQAAIAVMAYADLIATFDIFDNKGFELVFDTGYGFLAGGGYRTYLKANIGNPQRMVQRLFDLFIFEIMNEVKAMGLSGDSLLQLEFLFRMVSRLSYDLGLRLRFSSQSTLGDELRKTILETFIAEGQWWFYRRISQFLSVVIRNILRNNNLGSADIEAFLRLMDSVPMELNQLRSFNQTFASYVDLITPEIPSNLQNDWLQNISALWASLSLTESLSRSFSSGGLFITDPKVVTPIPDRIRIWINSSLQKPINEELILSDLMNYLLDAPLSLLLERESQVLTFITIFRDLFNGTPRDVTRGLLTYISNSIPPSSSNMQSIHSNLTKIVERQFSSQIQESIKERFARQQEVSILLEASLFPMIEIIVKHALTSVMNENYRDENQREILMEGISSALLPLVGRPLILLSETVLKIVHEQIPNKLIATANQLNKDQVARSINTLILKYGGGLFPDFNIWFRPLQSALRAVGQVLKQPFISQGIYDSLKGIFTPIGADQTDRYRVDPYMMRLQNPQFIPRQNELIALTTSIANIMFNRMSNYSSIMIRELIKAFVEYLQELVASIVRELQRSVDRMRERLVEFGVNLLVDALVGIYVKQASIVLKRTGLYSRAPRKVKELLEGQLAGAVRGALRGVLSPISRSLESWKLSANIFLNLLRDDKLSELLLSQLTLNSLNKHLTSTLRGRLGIPLEISVRFLGKRYSVDLGEIFLPYTQIIPVVMQNLKRFNFTPHYGGDIGESNYGVWQRLLTNLIRDTARLIEAYSFGSSRSLSADIRNTMVISQASNLGSSRILAPDVRNILVIRQPSNTPRSLEMIIHNSNRQQVNYRRIPIDTDTTIFLNKKVVLFDTVTNNENSQDSQASEGSIVQRTFNEEELKKGVNTLSIRNSRRNAHPDVSFQV